MSGVYIKGIKLPKDEPGAFQVIVMYVGADGKLRAECKGTHEVVPVPPHGRCIDADALIKKLAIDDLDDKTGATLLMAVFLEVLKAAPTIIPAEEGET